MLSQLPNMSGLGGGAWFSPSLILLFGSVNYLQTVCSLTMSFGSQLALTGLLPAIAASCGLLCATLWYIAIFADNAIIKLLLYRVLQKSQEKNLMRENKIEN